MRHSQIDRRIPISHIPRVDGTPELFNGRLWHPFPVDIGHGVVGTAQLFGFRQGLEAAAAFHGDHWGIQNARRSRGDTSQMYGMNTRLQRVQKWEHTIHVKTMRIKRKKKKNYTFPEMINTLQEPWLSGGYSGYILFWGPYRQDYSSSRQLAPFFKLNQHQENKSRHQRASEYCQNHAFQQHIPATRDIRDSGVSTFMGLLQVYWDGQDLQATGGHRSQRISAVHYSLFLVVYIFKAVGVGHPQVSYNAMLLGGSSQ